MLASLLVAGTLGAAALPPDLAAVAAAERGFALDAHRFGTRLAFLAHFDAEAWLFRPTPVPALPALARDPDDGRLLEWSPKQVGVAASGELAVSTGPWAASTSAKAASTASASVTSQVTCSAPSGPPPEREVTATRSPSARKASAMARPIPRLPPVTRTERGSTGTGWASGSVTPPTLVTTRA